MSRLIITPTGISIITNNIHETRFNHEIYQISMGETPRKYKETVEETASKIAKDISNNFPNRLLPAEIASLRVLGLSKEDTVILWATEDLDIKFCAEIIKKVLEKLQWCRVLGPVVIQGIKRKRTEEGEDILKRFKDIGLGKLREETEKLLNEQTYTEKYFNITGGFRGIIPFITTLASEKGIKICFLYGESNELIEI